MEDDEFFLQLLDSLGHSRPASAGTASASDDLVEFEPLVFKAIDTRISPTNLATHLPNIAFCCSVITDGIGDLGITLKLLTAFHERYPSINYRLMIQCTENIFPAVTQMITGLQCPVLVILSDAIDYPHIGTGVKGPGSFVRKIYMGIGREGLSERYKLSVIDRPAGDLAWLGTPDYARGTNMFDAAPILREFMDGISVLLSASAEPRNLRILLDRYRIPIDKIASCHFSDFNGALEQLLDFESLPIINTGFNAGFILSPNRELSISDMITTHPEMAHYFHFTQGSDITQTSIGCAYLQKMRYDSLILRWVANLVACAKTPYIVAFMPALDVTPLIDDTPRHSYFRKLLAVLGVSELFVDGLRRPDLLGEASDPSLPLKKLNIVTDRFPQHQWVALLHACSNQTAIMALQFLGCNGGGSFTDAIGFNNCAPAFAPCYRYQFGMALSLIDLVKGFNLLCTRTYENFSGFKLLENILGNFTITLKEVDLIRDTLSLENILHVAKQLESPEVKMAWEMVALYIQKNLNLLDNFETILASFSNDFDRLRTTALEEEAVPDLYDPRVAINEVLSLFESELEAYRVSGFRPGS